MAINVISTLTLILTSIPVSSFTSVTTNPSISSFQLHRIKPISRTCFFHHDHQTASRKPLQLASKNDETTSNSPDPSPLSLSNSFPPVLIPIAESLDSFTGGWALSYADLNPSTPATPAGISFLATNAGYAVAGVLLSLQGELTLGILTELAGLVSFWYHFSQLEYGGGEFRSEVKLALLCDYVVASAALLTGGYYLVSMGWQAVPLPALVAAVASVVCLLLSWVWEFGYPYMFWHSLWHVLSAYTGFVVGQTHLGS
mmetsp:Transcript_12040/g.15037  ORF Transcript_12040/g.15037 Transcript_12040/m.15037 type:complete len:257 (+) Transcript_12040:57-827(+)